MDLRICCFSQGGSLNVCIFLVYDNFEIFYYNWLWFFFIYSNYHALVCSLLYCTNNFLKSLWLISYIVFIYNNYFRLDSPCILNNYVQILIYLCNSFNLNFFESLCNTIQYLLLFYHNLKINLPLIYL